MYSPRARALLRSGRYNNIPRPIMARQRDRHHARPRGHHTRGTRGPNPPAQSPQGRPPAGGQTPGPRPGPNHLRAGGLPPGLAMLCLAQWIQRCRPSTGTVPWIWFIPTAHTHIEAGPDTRKDPPPRPQHSLSSRYHAIHTILRRVGLSRKLAYPLPTTDQEVHQVRMLVC